MTIPLVETGPLLTKLDYYEGEDFSTEEINYLADLVEKDINGEVVVI